MNNDKDVEVYIQIKLNELDKFYKESEKMSTVMFVPVDINGAVFEFTINGYSMFEYLLKEGFTKQGLETDCKALKEITSLYFNCCKEILELEEIKYEFTEEEAALLEFNRIKVNKKSING